MPQSIEHSNWLPESKAVAFDLLASQYYRQNFGRMSKTDLDVLFFSIYYEHCLENGLPCDDYTLAVQLGITESRVRGLKVKKQLQYPYREYDWQKAFMERIAFAGYDDKKALVKVSIPDPNVRRDIEHCIDEHNWYSEYQLNTKLLQMRADHFVQLCMTVNSEYAATQGIELPSEAEMQKRLRESSSSAWMDEGDLNLLEKLKEYGVRECLPDIAKAGTKTFFQIILKAIPFAPIFRKPIDTFLDNL